MNNIWYNDLHLLFFDNDDTSLKRLLISALLFSAKASFAFLGLFLLVVLLMVVLGLVDLSAIIYFLLFSFSSCWYLGSTLDLLKTFFYLLLAREFLLLVLF